ncbi:MAG: peptide chain release factor 1 [Christensenellaceae bacterium]|jgi:peptide chain release factor 1|nr:peptide chain release factor 1 [Christensenellaceae bacterium]
MLDKLKGIFDKYNELGGLIGDPGIIADQKIWQKMVKEHSELEEAAECYKKLKQCFFDIEAAEELLKTGPDKDTTELLKTEISDAKVKIEVLEEQAKIILLPKDINDDKNVIIEIRAGAGGDEAGLFGHGLMRMYTMYAERHKYKVEILNLNESELGGIKEAVIGIAGSGAYSNLKYESGVHRVQRVPETESQGRVHTSTVTVAVLPELEEVEFEILDKDLKIDTYRSGGAGGQNVNKTETAIRITHLPTGLVVACQDERSQLKNRDRAMTILKSKLYEFYQGQKDKEYANTRKMQVGTGDRSERIRTYNFPQGRITDHRINYTAYNLTDFMNGFIEELISQLHMADQKAKLENLNID